MLPRMMILLMVLMTVACARVTLRYEEDGERRQITLPFAAVEAAFRFSEDGALEIDDLGGISEEIDLVALAKALRTEGADQIKLEMRHEDGLMKAGVHRGAFRIQVFEDDSDHQVTLNLPLAMLDVLAEAEQKPASTHKLLRALKKHKGLLMEVREDDFLTQVIIK